jgi:predicted nucleic acid-binding Zn ribbon protein
MGYIVNPDTLAADICLMNEINSIHIAGLVISGLLILILIYFLLKQGKGIQGSPGKQPGKPIVPPEKPCPLCGEPLKPGERVHSVLYPGKPDRIMEIYGCPHCEGAGSENKRRCPVCRNEMPPEDLVIARVFEKPGKTHVHVLGCSSCYSGRSRR